jgi:hypothetical protein
MTSFHEPPFKTLLLSFLVYQVGVFS